ncbi:MAG: hypothetical protein AB1689_29265 [Thermodesulfobacteriota bacterium]
MRPRPATSSGDALAILAALMREGLGLRLLLAHLPPGSTAADARLLRERILQQGRRPSRLLDRALGIERA